jgi:hypothetical protein
MAGSGPDKAPTQNVSQEVGLRIWHVEEGQVGRRGGTGRTYVAEPMVRCQARTPTSPARVSPLRVDRSTVRPAVVRPSNDHRLTAVIRRLAISTRAYDTPMVLNASSIMQRRRGTARARCEDCGEADIRC